MQSSGPAPLEQGHFAAENKQAEELIDAGDLPGAARILVSVVEKDPSNSRAYNNMGIISWMQDAYPDAYTMFRKALELNPGYSDAVVNLFDAALKMRKAQETLPLFERAVEANPEAEEVTIIRDSIRDQGDDVYQSERALRLGEYNPDVEEGNKLLEEGKLYEAMAKYIKVIDKGPNADAFCGLGVVSYYQKRYDDAFSLFVESLKHNPTNADTFRNLIDAAKASGKLDVAKKIYKLYAKEFPFLEPLAQEFENA